MKISVIIPCFNAASFVSRAIESVLAQSHRDLECIVVDDASTDGTVAVVEHFVGRDNRVRLLKLDRNSGPSAARNAAIRQSDGEWFAILDADDIYLPDRLEMLLATAEQDKCDLVADNQRYCRFSDGKFLGVPFSYLESGPVEITLENFWHPPGSQAKDDATAAFKPLIRRSFVDAHQLSYPESFRMAEDLHFYVSCLVHGARFIAVPYTGYIHTVRDGSLTRSGVWMYVTTLAVYDDLLRTFGTRLGGSFRQTLMVRRRRTRRMADYAKLTSTYREQGIFATLGHVLRNPDSVLPLPGVLIRKFYRLLMRPEIRPGRL